MRNEYIYHTPNSHITRNIKASEAPKNKIKYLVDWVPFMNVYVCTHWMYYILPNKMNLSHKVGEKLHKILKHFFWCATYGATESYTCRANQAWNIKILFIICRRCLWVIFDVIFTFDMHVEENKQLEGRCCKKKL